MHGQRDHARKASYEPLTKSDYGSDVKKIMRVRLREWLQEDWEEKTEEEVRFVYSHGGTMHNALHSGTHLRRG